MENKYREAAEAIVDTVGRDNILSLTHCATRLRIIVKDRESIDDKKVEKIPEVKGVFYTSGQYQIILGTGIVNKVYAQIEKLGLKTLSKQEQDEALKKNEKGMKHLMRVLTDIFVPIIPIIAATGLFLGLKSFLFNDSVLALFGLSSSMVPQYILTLTAVLTETAFAFLPAIICWSAFRVFGGTPVIGLVIGLMLVSPILPNAYAVADPKSGVDAIMAFGFIPIVGCQGSVLTAIMTGLLGAKLEKKLRSVMPNVLDLIFTPFCVMLIMMLIILLGIGPMMHMIELGMVGIIEKLVHLPFGIGGFVIGFTYPLAVLTGLHHTYVMIETSLLANTGFNPLITLCAMYGFANVGSCLAFAHKTKKAGVRATSIGAMLSQLFGISEPVLFGILIRYNFRPLYTMLITSGIGAALLSVFGIRSNSYGLAVLPSYLMYIYDGHQLIFYAIISIGSVALCYVLTSLFAIPKEIMEPDEEPESTADTLENTPSALESTPAALESISGNTPADSLKSFLSPASGTVMALEEVADQIFSRKILGDGFAIDLSDGRVVSPVCGTLVMAYPTGHAYGIRADDGREILIHVGMNTVELDGLGFTPHAEQGRRVERGDLLVEADLELIRGHGKSVVTPVIFSTGEEFCMEWSHQMVQAGQRLELVLRK